MDCLLRVYFGYIDFDVFGHNTNTCRVVIYLWLKSILDVGGKLLYMVKQQKHAGLDIISFEIHQHGNQFRHWIISHVCGSISEYSFLCVSWLDIALGDYSDHLLSLFYYFIMLPDNASLTFIAIHSTQGCPQVICKSGKKAIFMLL